MLRDELRAATRAEHEALERSLALERADLSRDRYIAYLRGWLTFCRSIERDFRIGRELWHFTADCDARIVWLEDDLKFLAGGRVTEAMPAFRHQCTGIPELAGASYVIEGSMLGGQVIYRQLNERWRIEKHRGGSFLCGYGSMSSVHWRRFVAAFNDLELDEGERQRCLAAARSTFRLLEDSFFTQCGLEGRCNRLEARRGLQPRRRQASAQGEPTLSEFFKKYGQRHGKKKTHVEG